MSKNDEDIIFCKRCVISTLRPTTTIETKHVRGEKKPTIGFDQDGVCDACRWAEIKEKKIDWEKREDELHTLCSKHRNKVGDYDVIVPVSGGKDSMYVAHILKNKYKMNPLTVTWSPHLWTETGFKNHQNLIKSGFDNILISPNGAVHRHLTRLALVNLGHPMQPFVFGQRSVGPKIALQYGVKLIFYGENVAEYGNKLENNYLPTMDPALFTCYDIDDPKTMLGGLSITDLDSKENISRSDLLAYKSPSLQEVEERGLEVHYMSYYRKWVPQENYYYAMKNTCFEPSPKRTIGSYSKYSGLDDKLELLDYYMRYIKFGMGRTTFDAAQEIRTGKITREEGVALVRKYDGEFPEEHLGDFLEYTGLSKDNFFMALDSFRPKNLWTKKEDTWVLKCQV